MRADCFLSLLMGDWGCAGAIAAGLWIVTDLVFGELVKVVGGDDLDALEVEAKALQAPLETKKKPLLPPSQLS